jgi:hypothetical protein
MSQNSERRAWKEEELQQMLKDIMAGIHASCLTYGDQGGYTDYVKVPTSPASESCRCYVGVWRRLRPTRGWPLAWFDEGEAYTNLH